MIISEKRDKKAAKYLVKDLPYPYTSKAQFERSMEVPLGTEWNTRLGFQRATLPKVVTKVRFLLRSVARYGRLLTISFCRWGPLSRPSKNTHEACQSRYSISTQLPDQSTCSFSATHIQSQHHPHCSLFVLHASHTKASMALCSI